MDIKGTAALLISMSDVLILTHKNPDGDTIGSACALCSALRKKGRKAYLFRNVDCTEKYLPYAEPFFAPEDFKAKYTVAVDIASESQFPKNFEGKVDLCIDHHPSNTHFAENYLVIDDRASCGEIILGVIKQLNGKITKKEASYLYIAVSTDTGCFMYANTNASTFRAAAELVEAGAQNYSINERFFRKVSRARLKLEGMVYSQMRYFRDGEIAMAIITQQMLEEAGATDNDFDDLAAMAGRAEGAKLSITLRELPNGDSRVSLRSVQGINSSEICKVFGGGGHALAAGCTIGGRPERAKDILLEVINEVWK